MQQIAVQLRTSGCGFWFPCLLPLLSRGSSLQWRQNYGGHPKAGLADALVKIGDNVRKGDPIMSLGESLAVLTAESTIPLERKYQSRVQLKRLIEVGIKKRVKNQLRNTKFYDIVSKVVADPRTLEDAYNSIRLDSNVQSYNVSDHRHGLCFQSLAQDILGGNFSVQANTVIIKPRKRSEECLILPNLRLRVVQEAIRMAVEVVYRPHFSKISHGCRVNRGCQPAIRYLSKVRSPDWCFSLYLKGTVNEKILNMLMSHMQERIEDRLLYDLLHSMLEARVLNFTFGCFPKGRGLPQEGILSPLLMNIYLDNLDRELVGVCLRQECLSIDVDNHQLTYQSPKLRQWFQRQLKDVDGAGVSLLPKVHVCRYMDEVFICLSGNREVAVSVKEEIVSYVVNSLGLEVEETEINSSSGMISKTHFLGAVIEASSKDKKKTLKAIHKLQHKVSLFALQMQGHWDDFNYRIARKWLGHCLRKIRENEVGETKHQNLLLNQVSHFRKSGMETDHWFKELVKIWMQDLSLREEKGVEETLQKYVVEPALPKELTDSFYKFQLKAEEYISTETAATLALLPNDAEGSSASCKTTMTLTAFAPISSITKSLLRYGVVYRGGFPRPVAALVLQDDEQIVHWFTGLILRWNRWFREFDNIGEVNALVGDCLKRSCIKTLAAKHRMLETDVELHFGDLLSCIPSTVEMETEDVMVVNNVLPQGEGDESVLYGSAKSGLCLLSLGMVRTQSLSAGACSVFCCFETEGAHLYVLHVKEKRKHPGWNTGFASAIHAGLDCECFYLCKQHLRDLYLGYISLQAIDFEASRRSPSSCE